MTAQCNAEVYLFTGDFPILLIIYAKCFVMMTSVSSFTSSMHVYVDRQATGKAQIIIGMNYRHHGITH